MRSTRVLTTTVLGLSAVMGLGTGAVAGLVGDDPRKPTPSPKSAQPPPAKTEPSTATPPPLLYWADGQIHDGDMFVPYEPEGEVASLARLNGGWLSFDRSGSDDSRLVVVATDGTTTVLPGLSPHSFDVSPDREYVAYQDGTSVTVVWVSDASVVAELHPPVTELGSMAWAGDGSLIIDGDTATEPVIARLDIDSGAAEHLPVIPTGDYPQIDDVSADGSLLLVSTVQDGSSCLTAYAIDAGSRQMWSRCGVVSWSRRSFSPDGASVLVAAEDQVGTVGPGAYEVLDAATGESRATIDTDASTGAEWSTASTVLVEVTNGLDLCEVGGGCDSIGTFGRASAGSA